MNFCTPHLKAGKQVKAKHEVNGEWFCRRCFSGQAITPEQSIGDFSERTGLSAYGVEETRAAYHRRTSPEGECP